MNTGHKMSLCKDVIKTSFRRCLKDDLMTFLRHILILNILSE